MTQKRTADDFPLWAIETKEDWLKVVGEPPGVLCWSERDKAEEWVRRNRFTCTIKRLSFAALRTYLQRRGLEYLYCNFQPLSDGQACGYIVRLRPRHLKIGHHRC